VKFLDDKNKKLTWWTRNYFYLGTILFITTCILIRAILGVNVPWVGTDDMAIIWYKPFVFNNLLQGCMNCFVHANWQHCLLNMLCFFFCGFYVERKTGTFNFVILILSAVLFETALTTANNMYLGYVGASGMQFFFYGYIIIDYAFSFQKNKKNKTNTILGAIILVMMYVAMCFCGGVETVAFKPYPYDLMHNMGHYSPFVGGIILSLIIQLAQMKIALGNNLVYNNEIEGHSKKRYKIVNIVMLSCVVFLCSLSGIFYGVSSSRYTFVADIHCNYSEASVAYHLKTNLYCFYSVYEMIGDWYSESSAFGEGMEKFNFGQSHILEVYTNAEKTKKADVEEFLFNNGEGGSVPLCEPTKKDFYFEISQSYKVYFINVGSYCSEIKTLNDYYYMNGYQASDRAKKDCDFSFKIIRKNWDDLHIYCNGSEIFSEGDDVYVIHNVNEELNITFGTT